MLLSIGDTTYSSPSASRWKDLFRGSVRRITLGGCPPGEVISAGGTGMLIRVIGAQPEPPTAAIAVGYDVQGYCSLLDAASTVDSGYVLTTPPRIAAPAPHRVIFGGVGPGLLAVCALAALATIGGRLVPLIGAPVLGVAARAMLSAWVRRP